MKSHTVEKHEKEIILSIGMIVKNEEKVLERCLKSLQPLMKAIPSELIIADTGSTDSTVEIAKKYTDNVFHFEWINDFAAARNSTLEKAKGKWYFFLDADEYLEEDIHEIVDFFKIPELYNRYKCIQIKLRNYLDEKKTRQEVVMLPRFHKIDKDIKFIGSVHETINMRNPLGYFQTFLNHTGYAFNSSAQQKNKIDRYNHLMNKEYEATNPEKRHRIICHILDCIDCCSEEAEKYAKEALDLARKDKQHFFSKSLFLQAINCFSNSNKIRYALELCDEYSSIYSDASKNVVTVGVIKIKAELLSILGEIEKSYQTYLYYFKLYENFKSDQLDVSDLAAHSVTGLTESDYLISKSHAIECLIQLYDYEKAYELLDTFDFEKINSNDVSVFLTAAKIISIKSKRYFKLADIYKKAIDSHDEIKLNLVLNMLEGTFYSWTSNKDRADFAQQLVESGVEGKYIDLMRLYLLQESEIFNQKLSEFITSTNKWKSGYSEAIYLAIKQKMDITEIVDAMPTSLFEGKLNLIANTHDDFAGFVLEYGITEQFSTSIKRFNWLVTMYEVAVYRCFELNDKRKYELYLRFTNLLGEYVSNIYNQELLQDEADITVLPPLHKFGYYMLQANNKLMNGDSIAYIKEMKKALAACESMKEIVEFMLDQFKKNLEM